jgi:hypothetical protein
MDHPENPEQPTGDHHEVQIDYDPVSHVDEKKDQSAFGEQFEEKNGSTTDHPAPETDNEKHVFEEEDEQPTSGLSAFLDRYRPWVRLVQFSIETDIVMGYF